MSRRPVPGARHELVTVIIPARNEERSIVACLQSVLAQTHDNLQVVVVDGCSTDSTQRLVEEVRARDPRVELLSVAQNSIPAALNLGLARARGQWLVRVDAHSTVPRNYVQLAVERLREGCWAGVGGRKDGVGYTPAGRAISAVMASRFGVGNSTYHHGVRECEVDHVPFGAYSVEQARLVGGWDERLTANEDYEFDYRLRRAGGRLLFDPRLVISWQTRQSTRDLFRQYYRYGRGKADVAALHPRSLRVRHLVPPVFVTYAAGAVAIAATRRPGVASVMLLPYAVAVAAASVATARRLSERSERVQVPVAFMAMHMGWGSGFLSRLPAAMSLRGLQAPAPLPDPGVPDELTVGMDEAS